MGKRILVNFQNYIVATRDSGYKSTASALAELVDNSIEAGATAIDIQIRQLDTEYEVIVIDNGKGMTEAELDIALQFGGSSRFNSRANLGRYGMGLPNSSLSQCRRVEVTTWKRKGDFLSSYLDVDEVIDNDLTFLPEPVKSKTCKDPVRSKSGTIVKWLKCDRLSFKYLKSLLKHIQFELGRIFRYAIWRGVQIKLCGTVVRPFDPLFQRSGTNLIGGIPYGEELMYHIKIPGREMDESAVRVRFIELPVEEWSQLANEDKRKYQISKRAGVTVLRSEREIDYGWFFMGDKRKENYDDWWRCEIAFHPDLDEVFGVTHTKQEVRQTEFMNGILAFDLQQIAKTLNNRVRMKFLALKQNVPSMHAKQQLERIDVYLPSIGKRAGFPNVQDVVKAWGLRYKIAAKELKKDSFFDVRERDNCLTLTLNTNHIFYDKIFKQLHERKINSAAAFLGILEMVIFAAARSEFAFTKREESKVIEDFKREWSAQLKTIIS